MDEEDKKETEEEEQEGADADTETGDKPTTPKVIVDANAAAKRLEKANEERAKLLGREEELVARKHLGGRSEAGQVVEKKEETPKEYNERIEKEISEGKHDD